MPMRNALMLINMASLKTHPALKKLDLSSVTKKLNVPAY